MELKALGDVTDGPLLTHSLTPVLHLARESYHVVRSGEHTHPEKAALCFLAVFFFLPMLSLLPEFSPPTQLGYIFHLFSASLSVLDENNIPLTLHSK